MPPNFLATMPGWSAMPHRPRIASTTNLCGVDGSPAGTEAVRQRARLRSPDGSLLRVSVATPAAATHAQTALALEAHAALSLREAGPRCDPVASRK